MQDWKTATDEAMLAAVRDRSALAFEALYDRHHRIALAIAFRVVGDPQSAEDVVQEAFADVWRQARAFDATKGGARSWLLSIVRHRAIDVTRKMSYKRERISLDDVVVHPSGDDPWPEVERSFDSERVKAAVGSLPAEQGEAINLAYFGGYTNQEIADRLGLPLGTVKGRLRLGMLKLRASFAGTDREGAS